MNKIKQLYKNWKARKKTKLISKYIKNKNIQMLLDTYKTGVEVQSHTPLEVTSITYIESIKSYIILIDNRYTIKLDSQSFDKYFISMDRIT